MLRFGGGEAEREGERVRRLGRDGIGERVRPSFERSRRRSLERERCLWRSLERSRLRSTCLSLEPSRFLSFSPSLSLSFSLERSRRLSLSFSPERSLLRSFDLSRLLSRDESRRLSLDFSRCLSLERSRLLSLGLSRCLSLERSRLLSLETSGSLRYGSGEASRLRGFGATSTEASLDLGCLGRSGGAPLSGSRDFFLSGCGKPVSQRPRRGGERASASLLAPFSSLAAHGRPPPGVCVGAAPPLPRPICFVRATRALYGDSSRGWSLLASDMAFAVASTLRK